MATFTNISKSTDKGFILLENEAFLLNEEGGRMILETEDYNSFQYKDDKNSASFTNTSRNSTSFTNVARN